MRNFPKTFSDLLTVEHRWPQKGDRLLCSSQDWKVDVTFAPHTMSRDAFIWDGYMTAGAALIDEAVRRPHDRHGLVYPILFNYRHGLETAMKWTIGLYGRLANVELDDLDHDLLRLWRKCWAIFETAPRPAEDDTLDVVERIVIDFHELDKTAMAFRYSTSKNRATISLPDTAIDLQNVQDIMEGVNNFFHGADGLLSDLLSAAPERY